MGVIEAAGDVATGAAWSRVAEPRAGGGPDNEGHDVCLNCGTGLAGRYCHACGQSAHVHRTLMSIVHDLLHGVFHFEGKIWRTVPMLVLHPGQLTRRYVDGERARFVSPLALFLFTVFLMFAVYSATGSGDLTKSGFADGLVNGRVELDRSAATTAEAIASTERRRARLVAAGQPTVKVDRRLAELRGDATAIRVASEQLGTTPTAKPVVTKGLLGRLNEGWLRAKRDPAFTVYKVQSAAYKFSWALIFLSTPLVALLFLWRRRFGLYDHATFVTYSISFMSLLAIVESLLLTVDGPKWLFTGLLFLVPPAHMFAQLRGTYSLSVPSALWRTVALLVMSVLTLLLFVAGVVAMEIAH